MNGWTNRETWVVNLWFGDHWETQEDILRDRDFIEEELDRIAQEMPGWVCDLCSINFASSEVNWDELLEHYEPETV